MKKVSYLNLEIPENNKRIISLDNAKHLCYLRHGKEDKHLLHGDDYQLNSITDLMVEQGLSLKDNIERIYRVLEKLAHSIGDKNRLLSKIENKLDYLQKDNSSLHEKFSAVKINQLPQRQDLVELSSLIKENKPKEIELHTKSLLEKVEHQVTVYHNQSLESLEQVKKTIDLSHRHFNKEIAEIKQFLHITLQ